MPRSNTAKEGVAMLKRGSPVLKYGRQGKPHRTTITLSALEDRLIWEGKKGLLVKSKAERCLELADVLELQVGQDSAVFRRHANSAGTETAHLSLSLLVLSADDEDEDDAPKSGKERATLDVSFDDEEQFGYWVAALRALLNHHYYEILGQPYTASDADLRKAYRKLALRLHPDKQSDDAQAEVAADKFALVQRAYAVLSDRPRRQAYNDLITFAWKVETGNTEDDDE